MADRTRADTRTLIIVTSLARPAGSARCGGLGLSGPDSYREHQLAVACRRNGVTQEPPEFRSEERIALEILQPEGRPLPDGDVHEAYVEELLHEHWLRQCAGQSAGQRR